MQLLTNSPRVLSSDVKVTVLVGGVGGARFLLGVQQLLGLGQFAVSESTGHELTAVVNIGDDAWIHGLRVSPDLDTCMYTLGGGVDPQRGWGHRDETWHAMAELARYRAGELDVTSSVPAQQVASLRASLPQELQIRPQLAVVYYVFNLARPPFRDAPRLREALSLAIDRERLTTQVTGAGEVAAYSFVPPGIAGYADVGYDWRHESADRRLERAAALYQASGYSASRPLTLRLVLPADDALRRVAIAVAAMWHEALGVETTLTDLEYRAFLSTRDDRDRWDVLSHGWNADYPDPGNFLGVFAAASPQNDARLADPEFERLMAMAAADPDGARRLEELAAAERRLLDDYAVAPLYFVVSRRLVKPRVEGAVLAPMNHNYSKYLRLRN